MSQRTGRATINYLPAQPSRRDHDQSGVHPFKVLDGTPDRTADTQQRATFVSKKMPDARRMIPEVLEIALLPKDKTGRPPTWNSKDFQASGKLSTSARKRKLKFCGCQHISYVPREKKKKKKKKSTHRHGFEEIWLALIIEVLRADEGEERRVWSSAGMQERGKRETPEKTFQPVASFGTISTYENTAGNGTHGSSSLTTAPRQPRYSLVI
ncbi:hypothetical protein PR048_014229 [Dryococelus australis]|uniref:Uncharacterized protein n=1 Tax=Dryococelus australis TaxID=614101 RepID=A0ABQ9HDL9_9NEOP|nr:hypothetical protein PR048_014229 [Dryococelus australis]